MEESGGDELVVFWGDCVGLVLRGWRLDLVQCDIVMVSLKGPRSGHMH